MDDFHDHQLQAEFSNDGSLLAITSPRGGEPEVWKQEQALQMSPELQIYGCVRSPDAKRLGKLQVVKSLRKSKRGGKNPTKDEQAMEVLREDIILGEVAAASTTSRQCRNNQLFVQSSGWINTPDKVFVTLEYLPMGDLCQYLARNKGPVPEKQVSVIAKQLLQALAILHRLGFVHRDIKPENVLIASAPPSTWHVKLTDFGCAECYHEDFDGLHSTAPESTLGTDGFLAPEMLDMVRLETSITPQFKYQKCDVWALGETFHQLLAYCRSFEGDQEQIRQFAWGKISFPTKDLRKEGVSACAIDLIARMMHRDISARLSAMEALRHPWAMVHSLS